MEFDKVYIKHFFGVAYSYPGFDKYGNLFTVAVESKNKFVSAIKKRGITVVVALKDNKAYGAISVCSRSDQFSKKRGREEAVGHLEEALATNNFAKFPQDPVDPESFYRTAKDLAFQAVARLPFKWEEEDDNGVLRVLPGPAYTVVNRVPFVSYF